MLALAVGLTACRAEGAPPPRPSPLVDGAGSLEELARRVLEGIAAADTAALGRLRLDRREHDELVWPELPAGRPEVGFPVELAWRNIEVENHKARTVLLRRLSGHELRLQGVRCEGETQALASFHVLTDCEVEFRIGADGPVRTHRFFKDVLVWSGSHKIFRYYD